MSVAAGGGHIAAWRLHTHMDFTTACSQRCLGTKRHHRGMTAICTARLCAGILYFVQTACWHLQALCSQPKRQTSRLQSCSDDDMCRFQAWLSLLHVCKEAAAGMVADDACRCMMPMLDLATVDQQLTPLLAVSVLLPGCTAQQHQARAASAVQDGFAMPSSSCECLLRSLGLHVCGLM